MNDEIKIGDVLWYVKFNTAFQIKIVETTGRPEHPVIKRLSDGFTSAFDYVRLGRTAFRTKEAAMRALIATMCRATEEAKEAAETASQAADRANDAAEALKCLMESSLQS